MVGLGGDAALLQERRELRALVAGERVHDAALARKVALDQPARRRQRACQRDVQCIERMGREVSEGGGVLGPKILGAKNGPIRL